MDEGKSIRNKLLIAMAIFFILVIASSVLLYFVSRKQSSLEGADSSVRLSAQSGFQCEFAEAQKFYPFGDGVLKVTNDRIAYLTLSGNEAYSFGVSYTNPFCVFGKDRALVGDLDGYAFAVCDKEGLIYSKSTSDKVKGATVSSDGFVSVILDCEDAYGQILIADPDGNYVSNKWVSRDSGYPVTVRFNDDSSELLIVTLNTNGAVIKPYIKLLSIQKEDNKYSAVDRAVYPIEKDDILSSAVYCGGRFLVFGSDSAYVASDEKISSLSVSYPSINYVFGVSDKLFLIYSEGVGQVNKLAVIDSENNIVYDSVLGTTVNAFNTDKDKCVLSVDRRVFVFSSKGDVLSDISVDEDVLRVGFVGSDKVIVVSTSGVHTYTY